MIHCADLGNPAKPVPLAAEWARRITEEQFIQGDEEKKLGIPLNPLGDRDQVCLGKCQVSKKKISALMKAMYMKKVMVVSSYSEIGA